MEGRPLIAPRLRSSIALIIVLIVISSPVLALLNPQHVIANPRVTDSSNSHATLPMSEESSPSMSSLASPAIQAPLQIPRTLQSNDLVNSLAFYEVTFITSTTGAVDKIEMVFPVGTNIAAAGVIERVGIGGGTLLKSGSVITYDITSPVSIPAGTFVRLEIFGIKNPANPSTSFTATITTRDSGGNAIDGPTQTNVYTIKQIGTNDIAPSGVQEPNIANGAITMNKPNENFMKRVSLFDTPAGNAVGWTPDGVDTQFTIAEPAIFSTITSLVTIVIDAGGNVVCMVSNLSDFPLPSTFNVSCIGAPIDGAELHYVVENLPPHVIS